jgi:hypothetical protein
MIAANYISVAEFQQYAPEVNTTLYTTPTISGFISQASAWIDGFIGYSLSVESIVGEKLDGMIDSEMSMVIYPRKIPVQSVSAISVVRGPSIATLTLTTGSQNRYDIPASGNRIVVPGDYLTISLGTVWINFTTLRSIKWYSVVNYVAGYATIPDDIKRATVLMVKDFMAGQLNVAGAKQVSQGGISMTFADNGESVFVTQAKEILKRYLRPSLF